MGNPVRSLFGVSGRWLCAAAVLLVAATVLEAGPALTQGHFSFTTFSVSGTNPLNISAEGINNFGVTVGGFESTGTGNPWIAYERFPDGKLNTFVATGDTFPVGFGFTRADGVNDLGVVVGQFFDDTANPPHYRGFFYENGKFTPYDVPNQPTGAATDVSFINDAGDFCGYVASGNPASFDAFMVVRGVLTIYSAPQADPAQGTFCQAINIWGQTAGQYFDKNGVTHGFVRETNGDIDTIDVPGASTTLPATTTPCTSGRLAGTTVNGLNDFGEISGHFYTPSNHWHGYVRSFEGQFSQIDVPGAGETGGGSLNDLGEVTGHYIAGPDSGCVQRVYIAKPDSDGDDE